MFKIPLRYEYKHGSEYAEQDAMQDIQDLESLQDCMPFCACVLAVIVVVVAIALYAMFQSYVVLRLSILKKVAYKEQKP